MMKLGYFQVLTRPQIGQDHTQRLSVERENQLGGGAKIDQVACDDKWPMDQRSYWNQPQNARLPTSVSGRGRQSTLGLWIPILFLFHVWPCTAPSLLELHFWVHSTLWMQPPTLDLIPPPDITHALFIFQNISKEISPFPAAVILLDCLKERQSFSHGKLMQTHGACKMTQNW